MRCSSGEDGASSHQVSPAVQPTQPLQWRTLSQSGSDLSLPSLQRSSHGETEAGSLQAESGSLSSTSCNRSEQILFPPKVGTVIIHGVRIVSLMMDAKERLCLAQISNTLLKDYSYNEIHNRRVALGITCVQCTPVQLEILRRAGAMPISSRSGSQTVRQSGIVWCKVHLFILSGQQKIQKPPKVTKMEADQTFIKTQIVPNSP